MDQPKPLAWVGSSRKDIAQFPTPVQKTLGYALFLAQIGSKARAAKPLAGFGGANVLEIVDNHDGDTYRAIYTVRFDERIYVLHAFQKKSRHSISTPAQDMNMLRTRLQAAEEAHRQWQAQEKSQ